MKIMTQNTFDFSYGVACSTDYYGSTDLNSIGLLFENVLYFNDGSVWSFSYDAHDL